MLMPTLFNNSLFDLFDGFFQELATPTLSTKQAPATSNFWDSMVSPMRTDVKETEAAYELDIDLPGFKKEDVKAHLEDGYLTINASNETSNEEKNEEGKFIRRERHVGSCSRSFYVGDLVTEEDIKAKFEDGILKLVVPKKEPEPAIEEKRYIAIEG